MHENIHKGRISDALPHKIKLDVKDKKILTLLSEDARMPLSRIGKAVNLSRDSVSYRIKKLEREGIILNFMPVIDLTKLGFFTYHIFIIINETNKERTNLFIETLKKHPNTKSLMHYSGEWDLEWIVVVRDVKELDEIITEVTSKFTDIVVEKDELQIIKGYGSFYLPHKFYQESGIDMKRFEKRKTEKEYQADETDIEILKELCDNCRKNAYEIAAKVNLSSDAVIYRIKKMYNANVIRNFTVVTDLTNLGYNWYTFCADLKTLDQKDDTKLWEIVSKHPFIIRTVKVLGRWDMIISIVTNNPQEYHDTVKEIKGEFINIISSYQTFMTHKEYCFYGMPKIIG